MLVAETERLHLRRFRLDDALALERIFGDAEVMRYSDGRRSTEWIRGWLSEWIENHYEAWGFGMWAVVEKTSGAVIGYAGLSRIADHCAPHEAELGYRLARSQWGRGLATEATLAVRDHAFGELGLPRLIALIDPGNAASLRVAGKIGLRYERDILLPSYSHADRLYALSKDPAELLVLLELRAQVGHLDQVLAVYERHRLLELPRSIEGYRGAELWTDAGRSLLVVTSRWAAIDAYERWLADPRRTAASADIIALLAPGPEAIRTTLLRGPVAVAT